MPAKVKANHTKRFYVQHNVGKAKYCLNFHDGVKEHKDGSEFFDLRIFKNKKKLAAAITALKEDGYKEASGV